MLFVPELCNIISVPKITKEGKKVYFAESFCKIYSRNDTLLALASKRDKLFYIDCSDDQPPDTALTCSKSHDTNVLWHRRFGHLRNNNFKKIITKDLVVGLDYKINNDSITCKSC